MKTAIFNHKGGVGKTTLGVHVGFAAIEHDYPLTYLDADRQTNSMSWLLHHQWDGEDFYEIGSVLVTCNLDIAEDADHLLIDAPPDFHFMENLTIEPDLWIIPIGGRFSVEGAMRVIETLGIHHDARAVLVANMTDPNTTIGRHEIGEAIMLGLEVFPLAIPRTNVIRKAEMMGRAAWDIPYGKQSPATHALMHFAHWLLEGADDRYVYSDYSLPRNELLERYEL